MAATVSSYSKTQQLLSLLAAGILTTWCIRPELPCGRGVFDALALGPKHRRQASTPLPTVNPPRLALSRMRHTTRTLCSTIPRTRRKPRSPSSGNIWTVMLLMHLNRFGKAHPTPLTLTVYPRPNAEPDKIYIAKWKPEFGFKFTGPFSALGKSGQAVFEEI